MPPLELWVSLRSFELADTQGVFLDTLGMAQLELPDLEAYAGDGPAAAQVTGWLRNVALHLVQQEPAAAQGRRHRSTAPTMIPAGHRWRTPPPSSRHAASCASRRSVTARSPGDSAGDLVGWPPRLAS